MWIKLHHNVVCYKSYYPHANFIIIFWSWSSVKYSMIYKLKKIKLIFAYNTEDTTCSSLTKETTEFSTGGPTIYRENKH